MASYEEIHGKRVETFSSDPTLDSSYEGQVWFNSTSGILKTVVTTDAWFSQAPTTSQHGDGGGCGTASATLIWGGYSPDNPPVTNATEEFDGTGWAAGGNYGSSLFRTGGAGPQTAALGVAGRTGGGSAANQDDCYKYDGSSWTSTANYPANKNGVGVTGTQTAAIAVGGAPYVDTSFEFDGSSWTSSGTYPVSRGNIRGAGTQTAGIFAGGYDPYSNVATTYNGSTFTAIPSINTARGIVNHSGNSGSSVISSGAIPASPYVSNATERWDGSSWTTSPATLTSGGIGGGTGGMSNPAGNTSALLAALRGPPSSYPTNTEEYATSVTTVTPGAWSSGNNMNTARARAGGMLGSDSTQNASMAFGGQAGTAVQNKNEEYDGTSWTESGDLGTARRWHYGAGSQTAALCAGGVTTATASPVVGNTEEYDGSSWSEVNNMGTGRYNGGSGGTQTAAFVTGGSPAPSYTDATEEYDGTNWTAGGDMLVSKGYYGGGGTLTAGIVMGMSTGSKSSYHYDGSSWTAGGTMNRGGSQSTYTGLQTDGISFGGTPTTLTEGYDGTAWSTRPSMGTARYALAGSSGTSTSALGCGGEVTPQTNATEEFTGETTAVNASTLTTS